MFVYILVRYNEKDEGGKDWIDDRGVIIDVFEKRSDALRDLRSFEGQFKNLTYGIIKKRLF